MGKRKRMIERALPARLRAGDLRAECERHGVRDIYELPVSVHIEHRGRRLMGALS